MTSDICIFCKICAKSVPAEILYEDDEIIVFKDIKRAAAHHYLAVPKKHIKSAKSLTSADRDILIKLMETGKKVLEENGGDVNDMRTGFHWPPFNLIDHIHLHFISPTSDLSFISRQIFRPNSFYFVTPEYVLEHLPNRQTKT